MWKKNISPIITMYKHPTSCKIKFDSKLNVSKWNQSNKNVIENCFGRNGLGLFSNKKSLDKFN